MTETPPRCQAMKWDETLCRFPDEGYVADLPDGTYMRLCGLHIQVYEWISEEYGAATGAARLRTGRNPEIVRP